MSHCLTHKYLSAQAKGAAAAVDREVDGGVNTVLARAELTVTAGACPEAAGGAVRRAARRRDSNRPQQQAEANFVG